MKVITRTTIQWKPTLLGIKIGETLEVKSPLGMPSSLSSVVSRLRTAGVADFKIERSEGKLIIKRLS